MSVLEYALPQRPPQGQEDERDLSERALPRRSSSPVIGSPPVRAVPIGTPPKQATVPNFNQQVPLPLTLLWQEVDLVTMVSGKGGVSRKKQGRNGKERPQKVKTLKFLGPLKGACH